MTDDIIQIEIDFKTQKDAARRFIRENKDNPDARLADLFSAYPDHAFSPDAPPDPACLDLPLSRFHFDHLTIADGAPPIVSGVPADDPFDLRDELDAPDGGAPDPVRADGAADLSAHPDAITDHEAVRIAYGPELRAAADFLKNDLSALVVCDKMLTEYIYEYVCDRAGKKVRLDAEPPRRTDQRMGGQLADAMEAGPVDPVQNLPRLVRDMDPDKEILVLRSLDMFHEPPAIEVLYGRSRSGAKPQLLGFLDPSLEVKKVVSDRFAVQVRMTGLARHPEGESRVAGSELRAAGNELRVASSGDGERVHTVTRLMTRGERGRFCRYDPEALYKNVAGLNAIQFRHAMRYVGAKVGADTEPAEIHRLIRQFKISSSADIEIPDTHFSDIGGYESVKRELADAIRLIGGDAPGLDPRERASLIPRGFVFHGPPGTGKTLFAKAIANEINAAIQMVSGPEIMDKYVGQSESNIRHLFAVARRNAPAVIFFDEFDSLASQRSNYTDGGARANNAVVAQLLTELDGFRQGRTVLVIGATNRIDIIDEALLRPSRLKAIRIDLPDFAARRHVARIHAERYGVADLLRGQIARVRDHLDGLNGKAGEIPAALRDALAADHGPFRRRCESEAGTAAFLREIRGFGRFLRECRGTDAAPPDAALLARLERRLQTLAGRFGPTPEGPSDPDAGAAADPASFGAEVAELALSLKAGEVPDPVLSGDAFLDALFDLVAEHTDGFNNDEIRAVFQEARQEYQMRGRVITPRFIGQRIGMIRKRREERDAVHLKSRDGR